MDKMAKRALRAFTTAEVLVALGVVGIAAGGFGVLMTQGTKSGQRMNIVGSQMDLENQVRLAVLSRAALNNTVNANPQLWTCTYVGCPVAAYKIELRDAQNRIVLPRVPGAATEMLLSETKGPTGDTIACPAAEGACRWSVGATFTPVCVGANCRAGSFNIAVTIRHTPKIATEADVMSTRILTLAIPNDSIADPVKVVASVCGAGQYLRGYLPNAQPQCDNVVPSTGAQGPQGPQGPPGVCVPANCSDTHAPCSCSCWSGTTP